MCMDDDNRKEDASPPSSSESSSRKRQKQQEKDGTCNNKDEKFKQMQLHFKLSLKSSEKKTQPQKLVWRDATYDSNKKKKRRKKPSEPPNTTTSTSAESSIPHHTERREDELYSFLESVFTVAEPETNTSVPARPSPLHVPISNTSDTENEYTTTPTVSSTESLTDIASIGTTTTTIVYDDRETRPVSNPHPQSSTRSNRSSDGDKYGGTR